MNADATPEAGALSEGLYDALTTEALDASVASSALRATLRELTPEEEIPVLSRHVMETVNRRLLECRPIGGAGRGAARVQPRRVRRRPGGSVA